MPLISIGLHDYGGAVRTAAFGMPGIDITNTKPVRKEAMDTPRLSGYPIDPEMLRRSQVERHARLARKRATRRPRRWLGWLVA